MPEDVRQLFSYFNRVESAKQRITAIEKERDDFQSKVDKLKEVITQTGSPIVAKMPNGDTYVLYRDDTGPTVEKVNVINL